MGVMNNDIPKDWYPPGLSTSSIFYVMLSVGLYFIIPIITLFALFGHSAG